MYLKNTETIVLENDQTVESAVNELPATDMARMLGEHYLRECIHAQIDEGNIAVVSEKDDNSKSFVDYPCPNHLADVEKHFADGGSLAVEIPDCTEPECEGKCCTTYTDIEEFREICGANIWDYNSDEFGRIHLIPKF